MRKTPSQRKLRRTSRKIFRQNNQTEYYSKRLAIASLSFGVFQARGTFFVISALKGNAVKQDFSIDKISNPAYTNNM